MKLIQADCCDTLFALDYEWRECRCGLEGGMYNSDGDTILVTHGVKLIGLCNHLRYPKSVLSTDKKHVYDGKECRNAWTYEDNEKVTRLPVGAKKPKVYK